MEARVGTLPVGALFDTLLTGRRGVVRDQETDYSLGVVVEFREESRRWMKILHPNVRVRVVGVTH